MLLAGGQHRLLSGQLFFVWAHQRLYPVILREDCFQERFDDQFDNLSGRQVLPGVHNLKALNDGVHLPRGRWGRHDVG